MDIDDIDFKTFSPVPERVKKGHKVKPFAYDTVNLEFFIADLALMALVFDSVDLDKFRNIITAKAIFRNLNEEALFNLIKNRMVDMLIYYATIMFEINNSLRNSENCEGMELFCLDMYKSVEETLIKLGFLENE